MTVRGAAPDAAAVSVGRTLGLAAAANIVGAVAVATLTGLLAVAVVVVVAVRRSRQPLPPPVPTTPRRPVGVS